MASRSPVVSEVDGLDRSTLPIKLSRLVVLGGLKKQAQHVI